MTALLQELADAPEAEPFAVIHLDGSFVHVEFKQTIAGTGKFEVYAAPPAPSVPDGLPLLISGAIYDFAGFLTTQEKTIQAGARVDASAVVDMLKEWAALRGLKLDDAAVLSWQEWLSPTPPEPPADLVRDAERYRWLLKQAWFQQAADRFDLPDGGLQNRFEKCMDEFIDAAIERQGGE